jgi:hypothetical protein
MNLDLRPLTVSELLDRTFSIYRHRFLLFVALMAPQAVLSLLVAMLWTWVQASLRSPGDFETARLAIVLSGAAIGALAFTVVHWLLYVVGVGATTAAVSDLYGRATTDVASAFAAATRRLAPLLWLTFLMTVRLFAALLATVFPGGVLLGFAGGAGALNPQNGTAWGALLAVGTIVLVFGSLIGFAILIFMGLRYAVAIPAVMLEPIGGREAIRRSIHLMRGLFGRAFLLMICAAVIGWAAAMILQMPFVLAALVVGPETRAGFWLNMAGIATGTAGQTITAPILAIGVAVLYFEARIRHEALDLQVMTEALAPPPLTDAPGVLASPPPVPH